MKILLTLPTNTPDKTLLKYKDLGYDVLVWYNPRIKTSFEYVDYVNGDFEEHKKVLESLPKNYVYSYSKKVSAVSSLLSENINFNRGLFRTRLDIIRYLSNLSTDDRFIYDYVLMGDVGDEYIPADKLSKYIVEEEKKLSNFLEKDEYVIKFNYKYSNSNKTLYSYAIDIGDGIKFSHPVNTLVISKEWLKTRGVNYFDFDRELPDIFMGEDMLLSMILNEVTDIIHSRKVIMKYDFNPSERKFNQEQIMKDWINIYNIVTNNKLFTRSSYYNTYLRLLMRSMWFSYNNCERSDPLLGTFDKDCIIKSWGKTKN